eukprot:387193_1
MSAKQPKSKSRKTKKKSSNKQKLSHLLNNNDSQHTFNGINNVNNNNNNNKSNEIYQKSCLRGDSFNINSFLLSSNQETNKLSSQMLPTRAAAIKAKNGFGNGKSYDQTKEKDPRAAINDNRLFYEEYLQPFKCIQLFNQANLEVLTYKLHHISNDQLQQ